MTRERIWFIVVVLVFLVLSIAFIANNVARTSKLNNTQIDVAQKYIVKDILPESDIITPEKKSEEKEENRPVKNISEIIRPAKIGDGCFVIGCSNQICTDDKELATTCEWYESYACYNNATCERQPDDECGWTKTDEIMSCIREKVPGIAHVN